MKNAEEAREAGLKRWQDEQVQVSHFVVFRDPGDTVAGTIISMQEGIGADNRPQLLLHLDQDRILACNNKILKDLMLEAFKKNKLGPGIQIEVTYTGRSQKAKYFRLVVDGEEIFTERGKPLTDKDKIQNLLGS